MLAFPMSMDRPGASGALAKMKDLPPGGNSTLVYFNCTDCAVEAGLVASSLPPTAHPPASSSAIYVADTTIEMVRTFFGGSRRNGFCHGG